MTHEARFMHCKINDFLYRRTKNPWIGPCHIPIPNKLEYWITWPWPWTAISSDPCHIDASACIEPGSDEDLQQLKSLQRTFRSFF